MHGLASDIAFIGWSWPATAHALCVEIQPNDLTVENFNMELVAGTDLAPVEKNSLHFGSLACGHTNCALRAIAAGGPSSCPLLSEDGRYSLEKLQRRDPAFAEAVRQGLKWKVLSWRVRVEFPRALVVMQAARNVAGHIQRQENEVQALAKMHSMAASCLKSGRPVNWMDIKRAVLRSRPPFAHQVEHLVNFLASKSGGVEGQYLRFFMSFHRIFVKTSVRAGVPGPLYTALGEFRHQYLAYAILEAAFSCPADAIKSGVCCWVSPLAL